MQESAGGGCAAWGGRRRRGGSIRRPGRQGTWFARGAETSHHSARSRKGWTVSSGCHLGGRRLCDGDSEKCKGYAERGGWPRCPRQEGGVAEPGSEGGPTSPAGAAARCQALVGTMWCHPAGDGHDSGSGREPCQVTGSAVGGDSRWWRRPAQSALHGGRTGAPGMKIEDHDSSWNKEREPQRQQGYSEAASGQGTGVTVGGI